jgi:hypothetical protein
VTDLPKITPRPTVKPGKRKPLTRAEVITLCWRQADIFLIRGFGPVAGIACGCGCREELKINCVDEHITPRENLPAGKADALSNRALYNPECAKRKTQTDAGLIAKNRRVRGERGSQVARQKKAKRKIVSRGFDRSKTRGFDGKVRER